MRFNKNYTQIYFDMLNNQSYGFMLDSLPKNILNSIDTSIEKIRNNFESAHKLNKHLAGHIEKEFKIELEPKVSNYIHDLLTHFEVQSGNFIKKSVSSIPIKDLYTSIRNNQKNIKDFSHPPLVVDNTWVNFQKKGEYNPLHAHKGLLSYVIWYKIPYNKESEKKFAEDSGLNIKSEMNGTFNFIANKGTFYQETLSDGTDWEGVICIFPSDLNHMVYPFYSSEEFRITISANYLFDTYESVENFYINAK